MSDPTRRQFVLGSAGAIAVAAAGLGPVTATATATRSGLPWMSGALDSSFDGFASYRGRPLDVIMTYAKRGTWADIRGSGPKLAYLLTPRRGTPRPETVIVSYPMFPRELSPKHQGAGVWQRAAAGEFDDHHRTAAESYATFPQQLVFRIGWEWNAKSFEWGCIDVALADLYKTYFRRIVDRLRNRLPGIQIDWCSIKKGVTNTGIQSFYPGFDYVDYIGHDRYDWYPSLTNEEAWDKDYASLYRGGPKGIGAWLSYARSEGKPLSFPEWAVVSNDPSGSAGGDNPLFIRKVLEFFNTNAAAIGYECYFNSNHAPWISRLQDNRRAGDAYRAAMLSFG